ncbi:MAG: hypothetical protein EAZ55_12895 [Cytophagales bacterium]|nr:MAG: hypothetical protein EAZ55_12895 [Cytophagales bacterium]
MKYFIYLFVITFAMMGCESKEPVTIQNFDTSVWKTDKNACKNQRKKIFEELNKEKKKLEGLSQMQVVALLGKPDRVMLEGRSQRIFYYFLEAGAQCNTTNKNEYAKEGKKLKLRFSATDRLVEFFQE